MNKRALITGISGQDGAYLSKLLLEKNYEILGITRKKSNLSYVGLDYLGIQDLVKIEELDILNQDKLSKLILNFNPCEIYHLASQSSVSNSKIFPHETINFNINSTVNLLEEIRKNNTKIKLLNCSSSEIYGPCAKLPITENSIFDPQNIYAISKYTSHKLVDYYRLHYKLFSCNAILFNHESYLRKNSFFIKKLIRGAVDLKINKINFLELGDLSVKRDFGFAPNYVNAMWLILQNSKADNFVISSGKTYSLNDIVNYVFSKLDISTKKIKKSKSFERENEIKEIYGDNSKIINELKWEVNTNFFKILDNLIEEELSNI